MQAATRAYDTLASASDAPPAIIAEAAAAYGALGDELGQPGRPSLGDLSGALAAYHRNLELYERALGIDPGFARARRGLSIVELKIGTVEMETDAAQALKDFMLADERFDSLPESKMGGLSAGRMHANLLRKKAMAMRELGEYALAAPLFDKALAIQKEIAAADPKDSRSQFDVYVDLTHLAYNYEDAADPALQPDPGIRRRNLTMAATFLKQAESVLTQLLKRDPSNEDWKAALADDRVRLGTIQQILSPSEISAALSANGLTTLKELAAKHPETFLILDMEVAALISVRPVALRDPSLVVTAAEHEAMLTKRKQPSVLLFLAEAYRSAGEGGRARAAAKEGLALFPSATAGSQLTRTQKLLELQMN